MEILKTYFNDNEIPKFKEELEKDNSFKEKYEAIKNSPEYRLAKLEEKIEKIDTTFKERLDAFKKAVLEAEKNQTPLEAAKQKVEDVVKEKKDIFLKDLKEKADKKIPFIWGALFDWALDLMKPIDKEKASFSDKIFWKIGASIGLFILGLLGLKKWYEKLNGIEEEEEKIEEVKEDVSEGNDDEKQIEEWKKDFYYHSWIWTLIHLAWNDLKFNESSKKSVNKFQKKSFSELMEININWKIDWKELDKIDKEVLNSILGQDAEILLKSSLKADVVKKTLENNAIKLNDLLWWREYSSILASIKDKTFKIDNLSLNAISILSLFSINSFWLLAIEGVKDNFKWIFEYFTSSSIDLGEIKKDIEWRKNWLISKKLIDAINEHYKIHRLNATWTDEKIKTQLKGFENQDELNELIDFKNWLLNDAFLWEKSKTLLWKFGKADIFSKNLTYAGVIAIHAVLGWKKSLENLNTLDLPVLYKVISIIVGRGNPAYGSSYIADVMKYFTLENDETIFKNENDKKALGIIAERLWKDYLNFIYREVKEKLWYVWLFDNEMWNDLTSIVWWTIAKWIWSKMISKWAILKWAWLKKFGYLAIFSWLASAIHTTYNNGSEMFSKLSSFKDKADMDGADESILNEAEKFNKNLISKDIEDENWNKIRVLLYTWENWLEIIHDNNIYKLWVWFNRYGTSKEVAKDIMRTLWGWVMSFYDEYIKDELPEDVTTHITTKKEFEDFWKNDKVEFKWKEYNFSKIEIKWNKIKIWEWEFLEFDLDSFLEKFIKSNDISPEKLGGGENNKTIKYRIIEKWDSDSKNIILLKQWETKN